MKYSQLSTGYVRQSNTQIAQYMIKDLRYEILSGVGLAIVIIGFIFG